MAAVLGRYLEILLGQFEYDVAVLSQPWMYYWLLVPAACYLAFFFVKWLVLTAPIWMPLYPLCSLARFLSGRPE